MLLPLLLAFPTVIIHTDLQSVYSEPFTEIHSVDGLPALIRSAVFPSTQAVSNPRGPFNEGCVGDSDVPRVRMIFAGKSSRLVVIGYERGGRAYSRSLVIYRLDSKRPHQTFGTVLPKDCSTLQGALQLLRNVDSKPSPLPHRAVPTR